MYLFLLNSYLHPATPESAGVTITQSNGNTAVTEGGATDSYTIVLNSQPTADVTIALNSGTQLTTNTNSLTFTSANWNLAQTVTVTAIDDNVIEGNHTGIITSTVISTDSNYNGIAVTPVTVAITDNDLLTLSISDVSVTEGNSGTTAATFTVSLSQAVNQTVTVNYATADGTATAGSDYTAIPSTLLTFNPNQTQQSVTVNINGDTTFEPDETFTVTLSGASGATLSKATGTGTILNDDAAPINIIDGTAGRDTLLGGTGSDRITGLAMSVQVGSASLRLIASSSISTAACVSFRFKRH